MLNLTGAGIESSMPTPKLYVEAGIYDVNRVPKCGPYYACQISIDLWPHNNSFHVQDVRTTLPPLSARCYIGRHVLLLPSSFILPWKRNVLFVKLN